MENNILLDKPFCMQRATLYALFSNIFMEVPIEENYSFIDVLDDVMQCLDTSTATINPLCNLYAPLKSFMNNRDALNLKERTLLDNNIINDFSQLFNNNDTISLYQSDYTVFNETEKTNLYNLMKQYSFESIANEQNLIDHVSTELVFYSYLSRLLIGYINTNNYEMIELITKVQKDFLNNTLLSWLPKLFHKIENTNTITEFYPLTIKFLHNILLFDKNLLDNFN